MEAPEAAQPDPPARVGRLGVAQGTVQYRPAPGADWAEATANIPLTSGNAVATEQGRALLELPEGRIALESASRVEFQRLDDEALNLTLAEGQLLLDLRSMTQGETVQVVTPRGTASINGPGRYLVTAGAQDRPTRVAVHAGAARFTADGIEQPLKAGEAVVLTGAWPPQAQMERAGAPEPIMAWLASYDARGRLPQVVQGMTGAEDLMRYGRWDTHPEYGQVWYPPVDANWAPYRNGRWVWVDPWGWTWVDDAPWGFAPFHYGRWIYGDNGWGWAPRPYWYAGMPLYRPYYAPALVSFWGGFRWGFGYGWGRPLAWAPLGPGEWYRPWYRHSARYAHFTNTLAFRNPALMARYQGQGLLPNQLMNHRGATAAPVNAFATGAPIGRMGQGFQPQMLTGAQGFAGQPVLPGARTPGLTPVTAQRFGLAAAAPGGAALTSIPGARPPIPASGGRMAVASLGGVPRVVGPSGAVSGNMSPAPGGGSVPSFSGRGVPPAFNGSGVPAFNGGGVPSFSGRGATPPMGGGGVPAFSGRGASPGFSGGGVPAFNPGGYRNAAPQSYGGGGYRGPSPGYGGGGFAARGGGGGYSAPRMSAPVSAPRASAPAASRPSGGGHSGGGGRRR